MTEPRLLETIQKLSQSDEETRSFLGFSIIRIEPISEDHLRAEMVNRVATYQVDIQLDGNWITYGTPLIPDTTGSQNEVFYGKVLDLNAQLNGAKIGRESTRIVLVREDSASSFNQETFRSSITAFNRAHEAVYARLVNLADLLGLSFRTEADDDESIVQNHRYLDE